MNNMLIVNGVFKEANTFRLIPLTDDCPYVEMIYDVPGRALFLVNKVVKDTIDYIEKIDNKGHIVFTKVKEVTEYKQVPAVERCIVRVNYNTTIINEQEIITIVELFARNSDTFDYKSFFTPAITETVVETSGAEA